MERPGKAFKVVHLICYRPSCGHVPGGQCSMARCAPPGDPDRKRPPAARHRAPCAGNFACKATSALQHSCIACVHPAHADTAL